MTYIVIIIIIIMDQWIKFLINNSFKLGQSYPIIDNIVHLTYVKNSGIAFGLFAEYTSLLVLISLIVIAILVYLLKKSSQNLWLEISSGFIIGGAAGNLIDRVRLGFVIDYLDFQIWPVFNLADVMIVIGSFVFAYIIWKDQEVLN